MRSSPWPTVALLAAVLAAGCNAPGGDAPPDRPPSERPMYVVGWTAADLVWAEGAWRGTYHHYVPDLTVEGRMLLYNVTLQQGLGLDFFVTFDGNEVAAMTLSPGENRMEIPASAAGRYSYNVRPTDRDSKVSPAGGTIHVAWALRLHEGDPMG